MAQPQLQALVRQLCLRATDKAEQRGAAVTAAVELVRVFGGGVAVTYGILGGG